MFDRNDLYLFQLTINGKKSANVLSFTSKGLKDYAESHFTERFGMFDSFAFKKITLWEALKVKMCIKLGIYTTTEFKKKS